MLECVCVCCALCAVLCVKRSVVLCVVLGDVLGDARHPVVCGCGCANFKRKEMGNAWGTNGEWGTFRGVKKSYNGIKQDTTTCTRHE